MKVEYLIHGLLIIFFSNRYYMRLNYPNVIVVAIIFVLFINYNTMKEFSRI